MISVRLILGGAKLYFRQIFFEATNQPTNQQLDMNRSVLMLRLHLLATLFILSTAVVAVRTNFTSSGVIRIIKLDPYSRRNDTSNSNNAGILLHKPPTLNENILRHGLPLHIQLKFICNRIDSVNVFENARMSNVNMLYSFCKCFTREHDELMLWSELHQRQHFEFALMRCMPLFQDITKAFQSYAFEHYNSTQLKSRIGYTYYNEELKLVPIHSLRT